MQGIGKTLIFDSQIVVGSTKTNLIPLLILASKRRNDSDSEFPFLNPVSKHTIKLIDNQWFVCWDCDIPWLLVEFDSFCVV